MKALSFALVFLVFQGLTFAESAKSTAEKLKLEGLEKPVEILLDPWGIAHIYAETEHDLFFAQGYNAARDRLFQFEVWRRQATGTWAEVLGPRELKRDVAARLFRFRGDMDEELAHYHPRGGEIIRAFVAGVNARIAEVKANPDLLPIELKLLGIEPGEWTPEVVISRHQALAYNVAQELEIARALAAVGEAAVRQMYWFQNADPQLELDDAIDPELLQADLLELYRIYKSPVSFRPEDVVAANRAADGDWKQLAEKLLTGEAELIRRGEAIGSNNWALSGDKTTTGKPILANDPHRALQAPSLRYFAHLNGPGWNVIGGGEPVLPGISIGHNGHGAWGLTIFRIDNEDLYVYETDPDGQRYRYGDGWEEFSVVEEQIAVRGQDRVTVELKFSRHGPVMYEDPESRSAVALRAAWFEPGGAPYLASLRMNQAQTWEEFRDACSFNHMPGENMLWADADGNIGWQATGLAPLRPNWSGV
ncbi:MAG TPA: penicillin acylase family protein, partial [Opitutales bacterium]|nr:penicillin acylase family protein [Opitutales bacterium]